jgi:hypothetical protein
MTLHLARSDGGKSRREECDNEIMLSIVLVRIVDQPVLCGWQSKIEGLPTNQLYFFCSFRARKKKKKKQE